MKKSKLAKEKRLLNKVVADLRNQKNLFLFMPGDGRYQPKELKSFLGYDRWASWLIIVEWYWLLTLAKMGVMPKADAELLTDDRLTLLLKVITTTKQDEEEKGKRDDDGNVIKRGTGHDILALTKLMRKYLPKRLHRWLHLGLTSYDTICTAYALQIRLSFQFVFWPLLVRVDEIWRQKIAENADVLQEGRTHLQPALPVTVGFWLSNLHSRFVDCAKNALWLSTRIPGKATGAVGTSASTINLFGSKKAARTANKILMDMLGLPTARITTQITAPEPTARYYTELALLTGVMGNLGDDIRLLQCHLIGELNTGGSTSSTMAHKKANPIDAEQQCGMHVDTLVESMKVMMTLNSNLQRDLRWSSVMRSFSAAMVYAYQQISTAKRMLSNMEVDTEQCRNNFNKTAKIVVAELLHTSLQMNGYGNSHKLVNKIIVPQAKASNQNLRAEMDCFVADNPDPHLRKAWAKTPQATKNIFWYPERYIGEAIDLSKKEVKNSLR